MEQLEKDFIDSCLYSLSTEGKEICKEVEKIFNVDYNLNKDLAILYCQFFLSKDCNDKKLVERCKEYIEKVNNFKIL